MNSLVQIGQSFSRWQGCMTYTHTFGARNRFMDFSKPFLKDNKPAGLKVVDVVGWAPTEDTLALAENKCTKERYSGFTIVAPTFNTGNANQALRIGNGGDSVFFLLLLLLFFFFLFLFLLLFLLFLVVVVVVAVVVVWLVTVVIVVAVEDIFI
eukprot:Skav232351  [mRNA]  locus=scaffold2646:396434:398740:+ [translate_table: standard]